MGITNNILADFIKRYPNLLNFLDRLEIPLGLKDKTIKDICKEYNFDIGYFLDLMFLIINRDLFNSQNIENYSITSTIMYLRNSHKSYINEYLPEMEQLINKLSQLETNRQNDCNLLKRYFKEYSDEFINHLNYEDQLIFPYINRLEMIEKDKTVDLADFTSLSIEKYMEVHENLDEKIQDLKNLLIKYFKPFDNEKIIYKIIKLLFEMEEDLIIHELIENKILFPKAKILENKYLLKAKI